MLTYKAVKRAIIRSLDPGLLSREWKKRVKPGDPREAGHCAAASEAFYHLSGGKKAGMKPMVCVFNEAASGRLYFRDARAPAKTLRGTHWWIQGPKGAVAGQGRIYDVTAAQCKRPFRYEFGRGCGFQQPQKIPSQRAQIIIDRVENLLGKEDVAAWRRAQIARFESSVEALRPRP